MKKKLAFLASFAALFAAFEAPALQQSESIRAGNGVVRVVADPATGRLFTANAGGGRSGHGASLSVVERDGTVTTLPMSSSPSQLSFSPTHRTLVVVSVGLGGSGVTLLDVDTLSMRPVAAGPSPVASVAVDATAKAYVIGRNQLVGLPWQNPGALTGTLTEIDLRTGASHIFQLPSMHPTDLAADASGSRIYVVGSNYFRTGESMPGFINVFDTATRALTHTAVPTGRLPKVVAVSATGHELYVLGHVDVQRLEYAANEVRRNGVRPALYVRDAADLSIKRTVLLPETSDLMRYGDAFGGYGALDAQEGRFYAVDTAQQWLSVVEVASGALRIVPLEGRAGGLGFNPVIGRVVVPMPLLGYAATFSTDGERLDSVPIGAAAAQGAQRPVYGVSFHPLDGDTYVANGHEATVAILRPPLTAAGIANFTDLWWNPEESGWGLFLDQQGTTLFGVLFAHASDGTPTWWVMSSGARQPDGSFAGTLYRTTGPTRQALANLAVAGSLQFRASADGSAVLSYVADGQVQTKRVQRQRFNAAPRACRWSAVGPSDDVGSANFTSLWWDPAEPGWGLAVSHRGDTVFGVLFTYDDAHHPTWVAMSNGAKRGERSFGGELYRRERFSSTAAGSMVLDFHTASEATLTFQVDGSSRSRAIRRQVFGSLTTDCTTH